MWLGAQVDDDQFQEQNKNKNSEKGMIRSKYYHTLIAASYRHTAATAITMVEQHRQNRKRPYSTHKKNNGDSALHTQATNGITKAPTRPTANAPTNTVSAAVAAARGMSSNSIPVRRFNELTGLIDPTILKTITQDLKFDEMMPVQAATLEDLLQRKDCLVQAKTGTGKTLAFLIPAIQTMLNNRTRGNISLLIITPTRELAQQIVKESEGLLQNMKQFRTCLAIGGTNKDKEQRAIFNGCDILIATPGRLIDHMSEPEIIDRLSSLNTLVLDEADRLLDMGFLPDLKRIVAALPDRQKTQRQGMLFSATIPDHVQQVGKFVLSPGHKYVSTIPEGEVDTHERVPQHLIEVPNFTDVAPALISALQQECRSTGRQSFKAIVFSPTAAVADWYQGIISAFTDLPRCTVIHSRASQTKRTKLIADFKSCTSGILVATDVIARGIDVPDVSHVFQVGVPADRQSYIHRLGRTARAGKDGHGVFIIASCESFFPRAILKDIKFIPMSVDLSQRSRVDQIASEMGDYEKPYQAWMGYYKNHLKAMRWDVNELVRQANTFALEALQSPEVPALQRKTVGKMGLKGVPGLNLKANEPSSSSRR